MRGFIKDHGRPDGSRSARLILKDFVTGKLLYCAPPPHLTPEQRHIFHTSYTRVHIASRKNKVASADDDAAPVATTAPPTTAQHHSQPVAAPKSQLVIALANSGSAAPIGMTAATTTGDVKTAAPTVAAGGAGTAAARDPNAPPIIAEAERGLLEEMYHVTHPLTKTAYRKAKKDKSILAVMDQSAGKQKGKKGKKQRKQAIALADVEAHTNGKNPIAGFRRFNMIDLSNAPATAPLGAVPMRSAAASQQPTVGVKKMAGSDAPDPLAALYK